jgi:hypothetical protein
MSLLYFFNLCITKNLLLASPSIFFFPVYRKKKTTIRKMRSKKKNKRHDDIPKKRCVENSIVDIYFGIHETI